MKIHWFSLILAQKPLQIYCHTYRSNLNGQKKQLNDARSWNLARSRPPLWSPPAHALRYKFHANNESRKPDCYGNVLKPFCHQWLPFSENQQNSKGTTCTSQHIYKPLRQNQTTITVTLYWWRTKALTKTRLHKYLGPPNFLKLNKPFQCSKNSLMLCCSQRAQMRVSIWKWKT